MVSMLPTISEQFTNASLAGTYAITGIGRGGNAQMALVGVFTFDGNGNVSGSSITNTPGAAFAERVLVRGSLKGIYTVDADGSGYGSTSMTETLPDGSTRQIGTTFLITRAEPVGAVKIAQEVSLMQQTVDPASGSLIMYTATRHPDGGRFSPASFQGTYGGPGIARGNQTPATATAIDAVHFNGDDNFTAVDIQNLPAGLFHERRMASTRPRAAISSTTRTGPPLSSARTARWRW